MFLVSKWMHYSSQIKMSRSHVCMCVHALTPVSARGSLALCSLLCTFGSAQVLCCTHCVSTWARCPSALPTEIACQGVSAHDLDSILVQDEEVRLTHGEKSSYLHFPPQLVLVLPSVQPTQAANPIQE